MRRRTAPPRAARRRFGARPAKDETEEAADDNRADLADPAGCEGHQDEGEQGDRGAGMVRRKASRHAEHRLGDDRDRGEFQPMQQPIARGPMKRSGAIGDQRHRDGRGKREAQPGRERATIARAHQANREPDLAARRAGQELAERNEIGEGAFVEPAALDDEGAPEVAQMRDGPAEARQAESEEDAQHFEGGAGPFSTRIIPHRSGHPLRTTPLRGTTGHRNAPVRLAVGRPTSERWA